MTQAQIDQKIARVRERVHRLDSIQVDRALLLHFSKNTLDTEGMSEHDRRELLVANWVKDGTPHA